MNVTKTMARFRFCKWHRTAQHVLSPVLTSSAPISRRFLSTMTWLPPMEDKDAFNARLKSSAKAAAAPIELEGVTPSVEVKAAGIVGAGTMGSGIAMCFVEKGIPVLMYDQSQDFLQRGVGMMKKKWESAVKKGKISEQQLQERMAMISQASSMQDFHSADLVVEAVFEKLVAKKLIFSALDEVVKPDCILASNTSTLNIDKIFEHVRRPENTLGMHFFSPADVMPLLEVIKGKHSTPETLATGMAVGAKLGKKSVLAGNCFGFIGNRMFEVYVREAMFLLEEGASPLQIDKVLVEWGFAMGPCAVCDLAGLDIGHAIRTELGLTDPATRPPSTGRYGGLIADRLVELGRVGQKTKAGFYDYSGGREGKPDPKVEELIVGVSKELGLTRREISDQEIVERCIIGMVNEGHRLLDERISAGPRDIDVVCANGYGARKRTPMHFSEQLGSKKVLEIVRQYQRQMKDVPHWVPAPGLLDLLRRGDLSRVQTVPYLGGGDGER